MSKSQFSSTSISSYSFASSSGSSGSSNSTFSLNMVSSNGIAIIVTTPQAGLQYTVTLGQRDEITGTNGTDIFVLLPEMINPIADPQFADIITNFHPWEGDKIGLINGVFPDNIFFQVFDANTDGILDSTLVRLNSAPDYGILAVVWNTVNDIGETTLLNTDFFNLGIDIPIFL